MIPSHADYLKEIIENTVTNVKKELIQHPVLRC